MTHLCALAVLGLLDLHSPPARVLLEGQPVAAGEIWLVANRWGAYPGVLVGVIRNGQLEARKAEHPQYWEQAFDYKVVVGIAERDVPVAAETYVDWGYDPGGDVNYLKRFSALYISPPLPKENLGADWPVALAVLGHRSADALNLPRPSRRTLRFLFPDGRPLVGAGMPIALYGSNWNHCGVAVGIRLGIFKTDSRGEISIVAARVPLALSIYYYKQKTDGPAGLAFVAQDYVITGADPVIVLRKRWELPKYDYEVSFETQDGKPLAGARLMACSFISGCGANCGELRGASDRNGVLRFQWTDLRDSESIAVVHPNGQKRNLDLGTMRELLTKHVAVVVWED